MAAGGARAELPTPFSSMSPGPVAAPWRVQGIRGRPVASFRIVARHGGVLEVVTSGSVASLLHDVDVDPDDATTIAWSWRIVEPVERSALSERSQDDFPVRLYVLFDYDLGRLSFFERWRIRLARLVYGDWVPGAALCYVHAVEDDVGTIAPNAYSDRIRMIVVDDGLVRDGEWVAFRRRIADDFRAAFGERAPRIVGIGVAADTDDTGEISVAYFGDIILSTR